MTMPDQTDDMMGQVHAYREKVATYEALRQQIHSLLSAYGDDADGMTPDDMARYRALARQRDEALNEMRWLEQKLLDEDTPGAL